MILIIFNSFGHVVIFFDLLKILMLDKLDLDFLMRLKRIMMGFGTFKLFMEIEENNQVASKGNENCK